jgi:hypothetical protein
MWNSIPSSTHYYYWSYGKNAAFGTLGINIVKPKSLQLEGSLYHSLDSEITWRYTGKHEMIKFVRYSTVDGFCPALDCCMEVRVGSLLSFAKLEDSTFSQCLSTWAGHFPFETTRNMFYIVASGTPLWFSRLWSCSASAGLSKPLNVFVLFLPFPLTPRSFFPVLCIFLCILENFPNFAKKL